MAKEPGADRERDILDDIYDLEMPPSTWDNEKPLSQPPEADGAVVTPASYKALHATLNASQDAAISAIEEILRRAATTPLDDQQSIDVLGQLDRHSGYLREFLTFAVTPFRPFQPRNIPKREAARHRALYAETIRRLTAFSPRKLTPPLQKTLSVLQAAYLDHLRQLYENDGNAVRCWQAYSLCRAALFELPKWLLAYFDDCAEKVQFLIDDPREKLVGARIAKDFKLKDGNKGRGNGVSKSQVSDRRHKAFLIVEDCVKAGKTHDEGYEAAAKATKLQFLSVKKFYLAMRKEKALATNKSTPCSTVEKK